MIPYFSIVIPTFNRSDFILDTINSVLRQSFQDFEILIIDDGSTDNTKEVINKNFYSEIKIKYYYKINEERGAARNYGYLRSNGKYIVFLDSDDIFKENHLINIYDATIKNPDVLIFATKFEIKAHENTISSEVMKLKEGLYNFEVVLDGNPFACNFAVKKDINVILFKEEREFIVVEDWLFLVENLFNNHIYLIDTCTVIMFDHDLRSMRGDQDKIIKARLLATEYIYANYNLSKTQYNILFGHSYLFCAIHSYIGKNIKSSIKFLFLSYKLLEINEVFFRNFIKFLIGKKYVDILKSFIKIFI